MFRQAILASLITGCAVASSAQTMPPWSKGANDPAAQTGYTFHVADVDNIPDLHGNPEGAQLVLFIGGNQFFVLPELIAAFESRHPELRGHIFYETLPPGVLRKQMANHDTLTLGNFTLRIHPDIYAAGTEALAEMEKQSQVEKPVNYVTNDLGIMVAKSNPRQIQTLRDLAKPGI